MQFDHTSLIKLPKEEEKKFLGEKNLGPCFPKDLGYTFTMQHDHISSIKLHRKKIKVGPYTSTRKHPSKL
jgi:hypothetical protein